MFGTILEELFEITSLKDGVGVNGRIPQGVALPDLYANLLNAERSVESVLVEHCFASSHSIGIGIPIGM